MCHPVEDGNNIASGIVALLLAELAAKVVVIDAPPFTVSDVSDALGVPALVIERTKTPPTVTLVKTVAFVIVSSTINVWPLGDITITSPALAAKSTVNLYLKPLDATPLLYNRILDTTTLANKSTELEEDTKKELKDPLSIN